MVYQRPLRSDELWHSRHHKYLAKVGKRYFYSEEELEAFYNKAKHGEKLQEKAKNAKTDEDRKRYTAKVNKVEKELIAAAYKHGDPEKFIEEAEKWASENTDWGGRTTTIDHEATVKKNDDTKAQEQEYQQKVANEQRAKQELAEEERKKQKIAKGKSLLIQLALKRAAEKEEKRKRQRETGKKKVYDFFRKKG